MAYNEIILDESVLDVDSWLPEFAIDKLVESLIEYQNSFVKTGCDVSTILKWEKEVE